MSCILDIENDSLEEDLTFQSSSCEKQRIDISESNLDSKKYLESDDELEEGKKRNCIWFVQKNFSFQLTKTSNCLGW